MKRKNLKFLLLLFAMSVVVETAGAQEAMKQEPPSVSEGRSKIGEPPGENLPGAHRFWDKQNR
ncbi:MAG: hypothetical protein HRJ53_14825, partial [Acidobacteria bacterium Pan2503]|nr:hypothetical protein [Candidatus Acidoferrum panamensis]